MAAQLTRQELGASTKRGLRELSPRTFGEEKHHDVEVARGRRYVAGPPDGRIPGQSAKLPPGR